jgi:hypothetical protein
MLELPIVLSELDSGKIIHLLPSSIVYWYTEDIGTRVILKNDSELVVKQTADRISFLIRNVMNDVFGKMRRNKKRF